MQLSTEHADVSAGKQDPAKPVVRTERLRTFCPSLLTVEHYLPYLLESFPSYKIRMVLQKIQELVQVYSSITSRGINFKH